MKTFKLIRGLVSFSFFIIIEFSFAQSLTLNKTIEHCIYNSSLALKLKKNYQVLKIEKEILNSKKRPIANLSINGPTYTHSISPIIQPNGTVLDKNIHRNNLNSSLAVSYPLLFTGGNISLNSSVGTNMNLGSNPSNSYSLKYYSVSISQPLSFYRSSFWEQRVGNSNYQIKNIKLSKDLIYIKQQALGLYFKALKSIEQLNILEDKSKYLTEYLNNIESLYSQKAISKIDFISYKLLLSDINNKIRNLEAEKNSNIIELSNFIKLPIEEPESIEKPIILPFFNSDSLAIKYLCKLQSTQEEYMRLTNLQKIKHFKTQRGINGNISVSFGLSSSAPELNNLKYSQLSNESFGLSLVVPILDWGIKNKEYEIAQISYENQQIDFDYKVESELLQLKTIINHINNNVEQYHFFNERKALLLEKNRVLKDFLSNGIIHSKELSENENEILEIEFKIIELIEKSWNLYLKLENLTLFDFLNNTPTGEYFN